MRTLLAASLAGALMLTALPVWAQQATNNAPVDVDSNVSLGEVTPPKLLQSGKCTSELPKVPGKVTLELVISIDGQASGVHIVQSPSPEHSACASEMISTSRFEPAKRNGQAIVSKTVLTIDVQMKDR